MKAPKETVLSLVHSETVRIVLLVWWADKLRASHQLFKVHLISAYNIII